MNSEILLDITSLTCDVKSFFYVLLVDSGGGTLIPNTTTVSMGSTVYYTT